MSMNIDAYGDKIYLIKNIDYEDKKVVAKDMKEALQKYENYIYKSTGYDFSPMQTIGTITSCEYIGPFEEEGLIK